MSRIFSLDVCKTMFLTVGMFLLMVGVVHAAGTGAEIEELTGPATQVFEGLRAADYVRGIGVALLAFLFIGMWAQHITGGFVPAVIGLAILGCWFGAEAVADTIFTSGIVI